MRPVRPDGDGPVPLGETGHVDTDVQHGAGVLVADDVRGGRQLSAQPVQGVPALDAHRLDPDEHIVWADDRVGYLLDTEYFGPAGLVVHGCFHRRSPFISASLRSRCRPAWALPGPVRPGPLTAGSAQTRPGPCWPAGPLPTRRACADPPAPRRPASACPPAQTALTHQDR